MPRISPRLRGATMSEHLHLALRGFLVGFVFIAVLISIH
jgi:hypothetical protein